MSKRSLLQLSLLASSASFSPIAVLSSSWILTWSLKLSCRSSGWIESLDALCRGRASNISFSGYSDPSTGLRADETVAFVAQTMQLSA